MKEIASQKLDAKVVAHARAMREDVDAAIESNAGWVGIFLGVNEYSLRHKVHCSKQEALEKITDSVGYAKQHGLKVRYTPEDATRTGFSDLLSACQTAVDAGADRISIADTVGVMTPTKIKELVGKIKTKVKVPLHVHCHNDFGLALANSLAAYEAGVKVIDVTVNGLGERCGITQLHKLCIALYHFHKEDRWRLEMLSRISQKVAEYSGLPLNPRTPLLGEHAFTHKADLHVKAVLENPECYEPIQPGTIGLKRTVSYR